MNIYVAGNNGMVGSAISSKIKALKGTNLITKNRNELDLTNQAAVHNFFQNNKIDAVVIAAAKVGGIQANKNFPADFIYQNLMIQSNIIHSAHLCDVKKLLFLGSSCIYPKMANQPMKEEELLSGKLEQTNEPYAIAKIAGIKMCESYNRQHGHDFRSVMPTNLYGPGDNFHLENSHVIPALIQKFHNAKENKRPKVEIWGSGKQMREFLHVSDMADAALHILHLDKKVYLDSTKKMQSHVNVGTGEDISIKDLAVTISGVVGYEGQIQFDTSKPDGPPRKLMNVSLLNSLGWRYKINLKEGLKETYSWFLTNECRSI